MTHDEALKVLLEEIDAQTEVYAEYSDENLIKAIKFGCSCILREMKKNA